MIVLQRNDTVEMCQGDYGNLGFTVEEYKMTDGDRAVLIVKDLDRTIIKKEIINWSDGVGYFSFNRNDSVNIPMGIYTYQVAIKFKSGEVNISPENKFIIRRGVVNEL